MLSNLLHDLMLLLGRTPKQPSLLAINIDWVTNSTWVERLVAYRQLDIWLSNKHHDTPSHN